MRIITGTAKGTQLKTLEGNSTRPTASKVKEAVFSMLQFDLEGKRVLDLFAGSGQMALEAVSRGANSAVLVDSSRDAASVIKYNIEKTKLTSRCTFYQTDSESYLRRAKGERFDIIFLDPPYLAGLYLPSLRVLVEENMLKLSTIIVCESDYADIFGDEVDLAQHFKIKRQAKYGRIFVTVMGLAEAEETDE